MIRVTHVIDGLSVGGAEVMLANLLRRTDTSAFRSEVISLTDIGPIGETIVELGVPVRALDIAPSPLAAARSLRLPAWIRRSRPDVVQTWLYQADLLGGVAARIGTKAPVIWGIHRNDLDASWTKRRLAIAAKLSAAVSNRVPTRIACCSERAATVHAALGYDASKIVVLPNGIDVSQFKPEAGARMSLRAELGVPADAVLVGMIARFDPTKDHASLLRAAAQVVQSHPQAHFVLCGAGVEPGNAALARLIDASASTNIHALGLRHDIPRIDAALDVAVLSSRSEALPLSIAEAMASGATCVVTDVGDAGVLVGDTGAVVPPGDTDALARAIGAAVALSGDERHRLGVAARARIVQHYEIGAVVRRYEDLYREVIAS